MEPPSEDPTIEWNESTSVPVSVARTSIPAHQEIDDPKQRLAAEHMTFTPWHTLAEHKPIGGIN